MNLVLSPLTWLLAGVLLALLAAAMRRRLLFGGGVLLAVVAVVAMTPLTANLLVHAIESRVPERSAACDELHAVVLLSGGLQRPPGDRDDYAALTDASLQRAFGWLRQPQAAMLPLMVSGGGPYTPAEAEVLGRLLVRLGIDRRGVLRESWSDSTWTSATEVRALLPDHVTRIGLASSALHLPRAMLVFARAGFDVCPLPLSSMYIDAGGAGAFMPQTSALLKSERALYEMVGELWYRMRIAWEHGFDDGGLAPG